MIKYTCNKYCDRVVPGCMLELWFSPDSLYCRTLLLLPQKEAYLHIVITGISLERDIISVPEWNYSFMKDSNKNMLQYYAEAKKRCLDHDQAGFLFMTVDVMQKVIKCESERRSTENNFAFDDEVIDFESTYDRPLAIDDDYPF